MGRITKDRIIKALPHMSQAELGAIQNALDQQMEIGSQAKAAGLSDGWISIPRHLQIMETVQQSSRRVWLDAIGEVRHIFPNVIGLELLMKEIDLAAAVWAGDKLRKTVPWEWASRILYMLSEIQGAIGENDDLLHDLAYRASGRRKGIERLYGKDGEPTDDGTYLRDLAKSAPSTTALVAYWRDTLKKPGPEKGRRPWRTILHEMWLNYEKSNPNTTAAETRRALLDQIAKYDAAGRRYELMDGYMDTWGYREILESLLCKTAVKRPGQYRSDLIRQMSD